MRIRGYHSCTKSWAVNGIEGRVHVSFLLEGTPPLKIIPFDEIGYKPLPSGTTIRDHRADPRFPCVVAEGAPNPYNKKYRMCDGRHRLYQMILEGKKDAVFFVISKEKFMSVFKSKLNNLPNAH